MTNLVELGVFEFPNGYTAKVVKHPGCESPAEMFGVLDQFDDFYEDAVSLSLTELFVVLHQLRKCPEKQIWASVYIDSGTLGALKAAKDVLLEQDRTEESLKLETMLDQFDLIKQLRNLDFGNFEFPRPAA